MFGKEFPRNPSLIVFAAAVAPGVNPRVPILPVVEAVPKPTDISLPATTAGAKKLHSEPAPVFTVEVINTDGIVYPVYVVENIV